jgi:hypothetical protein
VALVERPQGGVVEIAEYWLNKEQALLVAVLSKAAPASSSSPRAAAAWRSASQAAAGARAAKGWVAFKVNVIRLSERKE